MQIGRYHESLRRYYDAFPKDRIHTLLFDDIQRSAKDATQAVYRFIDVDPAFVPDFETPHATGGVPANRLLERSSATRPGIRSFGA